MPSDYYFGYYFFSPSGRFDPCGMFTAGHITATIVCLVILTVLILLLKKKITDIILSKLLRTTAVILTVLELIKIIHSISNGGLLHFDSWVPLSYCSIFIYASWMAGFGKSHIKRIGEVFIAYGCPVAGLAFLIFPTTSLMNYPIWHFLSLHSMFFHSIMIFFGINQLMRERRITHRTYLYYIIFVLSFGIFSILLNATIHTNFMILREPYNIPIKLLQDLYLTFPAGYTSLVLTGYLLIPAIIALISGKYKKN